MPDHHPCYVLTRDGMHVLDRWYCHWEVYRTPIFHAENGRTERPPGALLAARATCDRLNAEHDAWLACA